MEIRRQGQVERDERSSCEPEIGVDLMGCSRLSVVGAMREHHGRSSAATLINLETPSLAMSSLVLLLLFCQDARWEGSALWVAGHGPLPAGARE